MVQFGFPFDFQRFYTVRCGVVVNILRFVISFIYLWGIFKDVTLMHSILLLPFYSPRGWSNKSVKIKYILILSITFESDRHKSDPADTACHSIKLSIKKTPINPKGQVTHAAVWVSPLKQLCNNAPITIKEPLNGN